MRVDTHDTPKPSTVYYHHHPLSSLVWLANGRLLIKIAKTMSSLTTYYLYGSEAQCENRHPTHEATRVFIGFTAKQIQLARFESCFLIPLRQRRTGLVGERTSHAFEYIVIVLNLRHVEDSRSVSLYSSAPSRVCKES